MIADLERRTNTLFFVGCFFALNGLIEMLFLENCNDFAELVRTGDLDFLLLRPIDEQFSSPAGKSTGRRPPTS